jgi:hypothetical protein
MIGREVVPNCLKLWSNKAANLSSFFSWEISNRLYTAKPKQICNWTSGTTVTFIQHKQLENGGSSKLSAVTYRRRQPAACGGQDWVQQGLKMDLWKQRA